MRRLTDRLTALEGKRADAANDGRAVGGYCFGVSRPRDLTPDEVEDYNNGRS